MSMKLSVNARNRAWIKNAVKFLFCMVASSIGSCGLLPYSIRMETGCRQASYERSLRPPHAVCTRSGKYPIAWSLSSRFVWQAGS
jgi:hypothetical protein